MAKSLTPILLGLDYQAVWFWIQACRLLHPISSVCKVVIESSEIKSFDDVVVYYNNHVIDERGDKCNVDYYQIKFHVSQSSSIGYKALTDPFFIGARKFSFLQKLQKAQNQSDLKNRNARFYLISPWPIDPQDPLATLVSNQGGEIRLEILSRNDISVAEHCWQEHLNVDAQQLARILRGLRIHVASDLNRERARLNTEMINVGLISSQDDRSIKPYEDLIRKCLEHGIHEFTQESLIELCTQEGLVIKTPSIKIQTICLGVRSFIQWSEYMEDETDQMVCFIKYFDNRRILSHRLWNEAIYPELKQFFNQHIRRGSIYHLMLDAHSSIAFASGYLLSKSGADVSPIQITGSGSQVWKPSSSLTTNFSPEWHTEIINVSSKGEEVALALCVTHEITRDVKMYIESNLPNVNRLIACSLGEYVGSSSIHDADHAMGLASSLQKLLHRTRTADERGQILHIFASAPNGFLFFLGKLARDFGRINVYEYDFGSGDPSSYSQSMSFPIF